MNALADFDQKHPLITGFIGTVGGAFSWIMQNLDTAQRIVAFIGTLAGACVAVLTLIIKLRAFFSRRPFTLRHDDDDIPFD